MRTRREIRRAATVGALVAAVLLVPGCEDDPILEPTPGEPGDGGSYGRMHFLRAPQGYVAPVDEAGPRRPTNPTVF